jgi:hypothetical protein
MSLTFFDFLLDPTLCSRGVDGGSSVFVASSRVRSFELLCSTNLAIFGDSYRDVVAGNWPLLLEAELSPGHKSTHHERTPSDLCKPCCCGAKVVHSALPFLGFTSFITDPVHQRQPVPCLQTALFIPPEQLSPSFILSRTLLTFSAFGYVSLGTRAPGWRPHQ